MKQQADSFERFAETHATRADLKRKTVRSAVFMASGSGIEFAVRLASIPILARLLSPEQFGLVAMVTAFTAIVDGIKDLGLGAATVQRQGIDRHQVTNLFWVNTAAGVLIAVAFCALSNAIAGFYHDSRLVEISIVLSFVFVWSGLSVQHEALMNRQLRQGELAMIRVVAVVVSIGVAIALALDGWGYWALVWREVIRSAVIAVGVWVRCPWIPGLPCARAGTGDLLRFGGELSLTHLLISAILAADRLIIGRFFGAGAVGLYRQAQQLLEAPIEQLNAPIRGVAMSALSALQHDPDRYRRYYEKIVLLVALATIPLGLFAAVYAYEVTLLILGPSWTDATVFVMIFGIAVAVRPAVATSALVLISCGHSTRYLIVAIVHGALLTVFLFLGIRWGAEGVAVAHVGASLVLMVPKLYYSFVNSPVGLGTFFGAVRTPAIAAGVMVAGLLVLRELMPLGGTIVPLSAGAAVGGALYLGTWLLQPGGRAQFDALARDLVAALRRRSAHG
jgi:O-antigen/teichoic acid export membrane protein